MCAIEVRRGAAWRKSACLSGVPGFIAAPDFSRPFADVAWCRNMLQPDEGARASRFKREKVEKRNQWGNRDKSLWDHTEVPEEQRELEGKQLQELLIVLLSFPIIFKQAALIKALSSTFARVPFLFIYIFRYFHKYLSKGDYSASVWCSSFWDRNHCSGTGFQFILEAADEWTCRFCRLLLICCAVEPCFQSRSLPFPEPVARESSDWMTEI